MPTLAFIEAAFRGEPEAVAQLVTIHAEALPEPLRVTDWPDGITSNGQNYPFFPFELNWAAASQDSPSGEGQLTIANVDRRIEEACDASVVAPSIDLTLVRVSDPNVSERAILGARIPAITGDSQKVSATIRPKNFALEPAVAFSLTPSSAPGLF